jgi:hypothetical protein
MMMPDKFVDLEDTRDEQGWDAVVQAWWVSLTEPIRQVLVGIYRSRFNDLPAQLAGTLALPMEFLCVISEDFFHFSKLVWKIGSGKT